MLSSEMPTLAISLFGARWEGASAFDVVDGPCHHCDVTLSVIKFSVEKISCVTACN